MTIHNGMSDRDLYIQSWSNMMVNIWRDKIISMGVIDSGNLLESVNLLPIKNIGSYHEVIEYTFNKYGIYVDKGVGKLNTKRKPQKWYNKTFYYYTKKLAEKLAEIEGKEAINIMAKNINE